MGRWHVHSEKETCQWDVNTECNLSFSLRSSAINTNENVQVNEKVLKKYPAYKRHLIYVRCYQFIIIFNKNDAFLLAHLAKKDLFSPHIPQICLDKRTRSKIKLCNSLASLTLPMGFLEEPWAGKTHLKFPRACMKCSGWVNCHHTEPGLLGRQSETLIVFKIFLLLETTLFPGGI